MSKEIQKELSKLVVEAEKAIQAAMDFADKNALPFSFKKLDLCGASYDPKITSQEQYEKYVLDNFGYQGAEIGDVMKEYELPESFKEFNKLENYEQHEIGIRQGWANSSTYCN